MVDLPREQFLVGDQRLELLFVTNPLGQVVEIADHPVAAIGQHDPFDPPVVGFNLIDVGALFDGRGADVGFAARQRMAKPADCLAGEGFGPDDAQDFGKVPARQRLDVGEHLACTAADLRQSEIGVDHVNPERIGNDQVGESLGVLAQLDFSGAAVRNVAVHPDPFADAAIAVADRNGTDCTDPILAVMPPHPVFEHKCRTAGDSCLPRLDGGLSVVWMNRIGPAVALIAIVALPGQCCPAGLFADHLAFGIIGPQDPFDGIDGGAKAFLAVLQLQRGGFVAQLILGHCS